MTIYIPWEGGESPLPPLTHVLIQFRDPQFNIDEPFWSQEVDWFHDAETPAFDIVGYSPAMVQPIFQVWTGGENPVPNQEVEVVLRNDPDIVMTQDSEFWDWSHDANDPDSDILLYRVVND